MSAATCPVHAIGLRPPAGLCVLEVLPGSSFYAKKSRQQAVPLNS